MASLESGMLIGLLTRTKGLALPKDNFCYCESLKNGLLGNSSLQIKVVCSNRVTMVAHGMGRRAATFIEE